MTSAVHASAEPLLEPNSGALSLVVVLLYTLTHKRFLTLINLDASPGRREYGVQR